jgi:hypothetical protein
LSIVNKGSFRRQRTQQNAFAALPLRSIQGTSAKARHSGGSGSPGWGNTRQINAKPDNGFRRHAAGSIPALRIFI